MFSAILDTSVLWPNLQRDFLLSMAAHGLYRPLWSEAILEELHLHEKLKLVGRGAPEDDATAKADHLVTQMRWHFDDAMVTGWEPLVGTFGLPDPDDEHVVAAAVLGGAGVIVTDNLKHFPAAKIPTHIEIQDARAFANQTVTVDPSAAAQALSSISARYSNPPRAPKDLLDVLAGRYGMDEVETLVGPLLELPE